MAALTLIEAAKLVEGDVVRAGIIETFARSHPLLRMLPFIDVPGSGYKYNVEDTLPGVAFRAINSSYTASTGIVNPKMEPLVVSGGEIKVDQAIVKMYGESQRTVHESMKIVALADRIGQKIIKGDSETTQEEFDGLQKRIGGNQLIDNGGGGISLGKLDEAIDAVDNASALLMRKKTRRKLTVAARTQSVGGDVDYALDEFGRQITTYNGLPILHADENGVNSPSITEDEESGSDKTSVYILQFGEGHLAGIQNGIMEVEDLGKMRESPNYLTRIEWLVGLVPLHPRCVARLRNIDPDAAAVV